MDELEKIFGPALDTASKPAAKEVAVDTGSVTGYEEPKKNVGDIETPAMCSLSSEVMSAMRIGYEHRRQTGVTERLKYALMAHTCKYDDAQKQKLAKIGIKDKTYFPLTHTKNRAAKSMLIELANTGNEAPFIFKPTPDPNVPEEVSEEVLNKILMEIVQIYSQLENMSVQELPPEMQAKLQDLIAAATSRGYDEVENAEENYANIRAKRLQRKVWDMMVEGDYIDACMECLDNVIVYGTCVMAGPVMRNVAKNEVVKDKKSKVRKLKRVIKSIPTFEALNPVDCYPSPDARKVTDGALCVRVRYTKEELWRFKNSSAKKGKFAGAEGWRDAAVSELLKNNEFGCRLTEFPRDTEFDRAENNESDGVNSCKFEGVRYFSYVEGMKLIDIGITKAPNGANIECDEFYYIEAIVIGGMVVFCRIYDERIGSPLSKAVFYEIPSSWWGESIADKLFSTQSVMNNAMISLLRNMGPSSAAMLWINDVSRLANKSPDGLTAEPGKIFGFNASYTGQTAAGAPMGVLAIPSNASELLAVAKWATQQADLDSGIPAFTEGAGGSSGGALRTAEGLRTFTEAASRGMKMIIFMYDRQLTCDVARRTANWVLIYDDDMELKGDIEVFANGIMGRINKAQNDQARLQILNMVLNSQMLSGILGVKGILELFRPSLKDVNVNPDNIAPSAERLEMLEQIEGIKQVFAATQASDGVQQNAAEAQGGGAPPGIQQPPAVQGGVSERRGVA